MQPENLDRVSFKEFVNISKWVVKIVFKIHPVFAGVSLFAQLVQGVQPIIYSWVFSKVLDFVVKVASSQNPDVRTLYPMFNYLIAYQVFFVVIGYLNTFFTRSLDIKANPAIEKMIYEKIFSLGVQTLEDPDTNNRIYRARTILYSVIRYYYRTSDLFSSLLSTMLAAGIALSFSPITMAIIIAITIPRYFYDKDLRRKNWKIDRDNTEARRAAYAHSGELSNPSSLQEVYMSNAFGYLDARFTNFFSWYTELLVNLRRGGLFKIYIFGFLGDLSLYYAYFEVFSKFIKGLSSVGSVSFNVNIISDVKRNLFMTLSTFTDMFEQAVQIKDVYSLFQTQPSFQDGHVVLPKLSTGPDIAISHVFFKYPRSERMVLNDINLTIKAGERVAIVGPNGAGKTTLVKLISRIYLPIKGTIKIHGTDIKKLNSSSLHNNMGVLFQDYNKYGALTVRENIFIGDSSQPLDEKRMVEAAESADALSFIEQLPKKYDQLLSERFKGGIRPSTGQWQKIALARFFYRNSPLVIFDEPTAAIDAESEYRIFNKIYSFFKDKTVIIISHRFSTVRNADRIVVLGDGKIVEEGSHEQLMKNEGQYAKAFRLQAEGYQIDKVGSIADSQSSN